MMFLIQLLFLLTAINLVEFKVIEPNRQLSDKVPRLRSLFPIDKTDSLLETRKNEICDTDECEIIADDFNRGMNRSVDPCDDFYEFVCGAWEEFSEMPPYAPSWSRFDVFQDTVYRRISAIMETAPEPTDILPVRQAKKWYRACLDIDTLEKRGIKPLESILLQVGGWPMTLDPEEWNEQEHSWHSVEHDYFHITGSYVFFDVELTNDKIQLEKGSIPLEQKLPSKYRNYTGNDYEAYLNLITSVTEMFVKHNKAAVTDDMIKKDVEDVVEFEREIYMLIKSLDEDDRSQMSIAEFEEQYNGNISELELEDPIKTIHFEHMIRRKFDLVNLRINNSFSVGVDHMSYYVRLTELLNRTPTRTTVNYINWHFVSQMLTYTTEFLRDAFFVLMENEFDVKARQPRWLECIDEMDMKAAAAYAFVQMYYTSEVEEAAQEMIENVREEMKIQIDKSSWMDEASKTFGKEKLDAMKVYAGFPDWYKNRTAVLNIYRGLTIGNDHFDNVLSYKKYQMKLSFRPPDDDSKYFPISGEVPIEYNAFYVPWNNIVVLPAANFQPPLFTSRVPPSVNYGLVGHTIGHEMGHGFDDDGIEWSKSGTRTTLSKDMLKSYHERANCFIDQFNDYFGETENPDSDKPSRGRFTRPDNIADSTALDPVLKAFQKYIRENPAVNFKLPSFEKDTDDQMFFISYASTWCDAVTPKYAEKMKEVDEHSPGRLRVIGPISNSYEFAKVFNCPKGSPMNPDRKCDIWR